MEELLHMHGFDAIIHVMELHKIPSLYALAKTLSDELLTVQPIQISNYLKGTKMSKKVADRFTEVYDIVIDDVHDTTTWRRRKDVY